MIAAFSTVTWIAACSTKPAHEEDSDSDTAPPETDNGGDSDADADADGDTDTDSDADSDTDADTDADTDSDSDTDADGNKFVGNITTMGRVRPDFLQYWDQITPENEGKWASIERTRDSYNWNAVETIYDFAKEHNLPFKQHTFIWGAGVVGWISSLDPPAQAAEIEEWMRDFCERFPDTDMIDVVNEATPGHMPASYAKSAFGDDWIITAFELAREHCPNAVLVLNDYNILI
jgi:GH35 family endo-1,4-beta-xylanase